MSLMSKMDIQVVYGALDSVHGAWNISIHSCIGTIWYKLDEDRR